MKAIFIDDASLYHIGLALGLRGGVFYPALYEILTQQIGTEREWLKPVITIHPNKARLLGKQLALTGYELIETTSIAGRDDALIKERIKKLDSRVQEIILVSNDSDFCPALQEKQVQGVRIIWVGTRAIEQGSAQSSLGSLVEYYVAQGKFEFVELDAFTDKLEFERPAATLPSQSTRLIIDVPDPDDLPRLVGEAAPLLSEIIARYPRVRLSIEGPWDRKQKVRT